MEQKNNTGAIFKNERKEHERQPDYRGTAMIRGQKTDISLWINESKTGVKYFGATFSDPYKPEDGESDIKKQTVKVDENIDDDLPF